MSRMPVLLLTTTAVFARRAAAIGLAIVAGMSTAAAQPTPTPVVAGGTPSASASTAPAGESSSVTPPASDAAAATGAARPVDAAALDPALLATIEQLVDARVAARLEKQPATAGWKDGFFVQTANGATRLKIGGFAQFDGRFFVDDTQDPRVDQFGFRSIRPEFQGTLFDHFDFRLLPDFAGGRLAIQDAYVDVRYGDKVKFRFGKFKVPFGLERLQSETNTVFAERGLPSQIAPNRDLGVQVFGELARGVLSYQAGVFNGVADGQSGDGDVSDDKEVAARVFVKPFATGGARVKELGVGAAVTYGDKLGTLVSPDVAGFRTSGQSGFFAYRVGTTLMDTVIADGPHWRATGQGHYYTGPFGVLAEYVRSRQKAAIDGTHARITLDSWQAVGQWVFGGDASYRGVSPRRPFDPARGQWGAFDVVARIGQLRVVGEEAFPLFVDPARSASTAWSGGGGVDWFANRNFRVAVDLERTWYEGGARDGADKPAETSVIGRVQSVF